MENEELIEEFRTIKEVEQGLASSTLKEYEHDLDLFFRFLKFKPVEQISLSDIRKFLTHCSKKRKYKKISLGRKISTIKSFFFFLKEEGYIAENPAEKIRTPKLDKTLPIVPTEEEAKELIQSIKDADSIFSVRDLAIISTFLYTGLRVQGIHNLNIRDVNFKNKTLRVVEKGGKHRIVQINDVGLQAIKKYLEIRPDIENENALFLSRKKQRIAIRTIQHIVSKYKDLAGINPKISSHKLRHFFCTFALSRGLDIRLIQKQVGHSQLSTTQKYTHVVDELLEREYRKAFGNLDFGVVEE